MTLLQDLKTISKCTDCHYCNSFRKHEECIKCDEAYARLEKFITGFEWHDLRKDPKDLPKGRWVLCRCQGNQFQVMRMDPGGDWLTWWPDTAIFMHSFVIAWLDLGIFKEMM